MVRKLTRFLSLKFILFLTLIGLPGCGNRSYQKLIYMPDMYWSPAVKAQREGSMRLPPAGAYPANFNPSEASFDVKAANPLKPTRLVLERGQKVFNTFCIVCHGPAGEGNGYIVPKFPMPPSLQSDKVRNWPDGAIFQVIKNGQNLMSSYASEIVEEDRWAAIHYIRALQRSKHPTPDDLKAYDEEMKGSK